MAITLKQLEGSLKETLPLYVAALNGTLASPADTSCLQFPGGTPTAMVSVTFANRMEIPIAVAYAAPQGLKMPSGQTTLGGELITFFSGVPWNGTSAGFIPPMIDGYQVVFRIASALSSRRRPPAV